MSSNQDKDKKRTREARNLRSAKESRERKVMLKAHLTAEKARLLEQNAILRAQMESMNRASGGGSSGAGPSSAPRGGGSSSRHAGGGHDDMLELSDAMSKLFGGRKEISSRAAVDMLDRVLTGSKDKPAPVDQELVDLWDAAQARAPVVPKPQYYASPAEAARKAMEIAEKRKRAKEKKAAREAARAAAASKKGGSSSKRH